jgi:hypothetical protein
LATQLDVFGNIHIIEVPRAGIILCGNLLKQFLCQEGLTVKQRTVAGDALNYLVQQTTFVSPGLSEDKDDILYLPTGVSL